MAAGKRINGTRKVSTKLSKVATSKDNPSATEFKAEFHDDSTCIPPLRVHTQSYHKPDLQNDSKTATELLSWFDKYFSDRAMPWRKTWSKETATSTRAYEVWVSEIMLQQTRVSTVIPYYQNWIAKWPTVQALASADQEEVLSAWKGLGYYSRATRLHEAAQQIVSEMNGIITSDVPGLLKIKGIGPYTAGAISSIAFGRAVPLLDGNVARVLSRQLGIYANVKDKKIEDLFWKVAGDLVKSAANCDSSQVSSDIPGRWNQALMELGSTVCTPKPKCSKCPIQTTCRARREAESWCDGLLEVTEKKETAKQEDVVDIEDMCTICLPMPEEDIEAISADIVLLKQNSKKRSARQLESDKPSKIAKTSGKKQTTLDAFRKSKPVPEVVSDVLSEPAEEIHQDNDPLSEVKSSYAALFPARVVKKQVPVQDCLVCIIRLSTQSTGKQFLIEQRPPKGLLANLWQFPTLELHLESPPLNDSEKQEKARAFAKSMLQSCTIFDAEATTAIDITSLSPGQELGTLQHVFSHLKLSMHILAFDVKTRPGGNKQDEEYERVDKKAHPAKKQKWVDEQGVHDANLGTGMQKCWNRYLEWDRKT